MKRQVAAAGVIFHFAIWKSSKRTPVVEGISAMMRLCFPYPGLLMWWSMTISTGRVHEMVFWPNRSLVEVSRAMKQSVFSGREAGRSWTSSLPGRNWYMEIMPPSTKTWGWAPRSRRVWARPRILPKASPSGRRCARIAGCLAAPLWAMIFWARERSTLEW